MPPRSKQPRGLNLTTTERSSSTLRRRSESTRPGITASPVSIIFVVVHHAVSTRIKELKCVHCPSELSADQREALSKSKRISNPGCYPTGFIGLTRPLVDAGILKEGTPLTVNAISGYSGGGKGLMNIYENEEHEPWGAYGFSLVCTTEQCDDIVEMHSQHGFRYCDFSKCTDRLWIAFFPC